MPTMDETELLTLLAHSGLSDDAYAELAARLRANETRAAAADALVAAIEDAAHYMPDTVIAAVGRYRLASLDRDAAGSAVASAA